MTRKPAYEELAQRIEELEKEAAERERGVEDLRKSEERYREFFNGAEDLMAIFDVGSTDLKTLIMMRCSTSIRRAHSVLGT